MGAMAGSSRLTAYKKSNKGILQLVLYRIKRQKRPEPSDLKISRSSTGSTTHHGCDGLSPFGYPGTGMSVSQQDLMTNILQSRIAMSKLISDLSKITSGNSITLMIPANRKFTSEKKGLSIFVPSTARDFMDQLELYIALLFVLFTRRSYVYKRGKEIISQFKEHYQFLHSQLDKYGESCQVHLLKAIHNSFNYFFVIAKKIRKFKASGIALSLMHDENRNRDFTLNLDFQAVNPTMPQSPSMNTTKPKRRQPISFEQHIEELKGFKEKHGNCDINSSFKENK
jgi:hypothetical protein